MKKHRKATILAGQIAKHHPYKEQALSAREWWSQIMRTAWGALDVYPNAKVYSVVKKSGAREKYVLLGEWSRLHLVKGTGRPVPQNYQLFTDIARRIAGKKDTVMFNPLLMWEIG